jgi:hypothetical protein
VVFAGDPKDSPGKAKPGPGEATLEERALMALRDNDAEALEKLAKEVAGLDAEARRDLPVRVRADGVEFRFRGTFPAKDFSPEMFEYVIARAGEKDYEATLAVGKGEMARLQQLGRVLEQLKGKGKARALEIKLAWAEKDQGRVEDLGDLLRLEAAGKRNEFVKQLEINEYGLGGTLNVKADPEALPRERVPAMVLITVRLGR